MAKATVLRLLPGQTKLVIPPRPPPMSVFHQEERRLGYVHVLVLRLIPPAGVLFNL